MFDCANVEMRELLPELAAGTLDARTRARIEEHLTGCAECASELETLKLVRATYGAAPVIDTRRIVGALPKPPAATSAPRTAPPRRRWMDWRVAAALTMVTVGGLSVVLTRRPKPEPPPVMDSVPAGDLRQGGDSVPLMAQGPRPADTTRPKTLPSTGAKTERVQLSFGGGVSDLDDASLEALLAALDEIDRASVALSAEPDHSPVLPASREGSR